MEMLEDHLKEVFLQIEILEDHLKKVLLQLKEESLQMIRESDHLERERYRLERGDLLNEIIQQLNIHHRLNRRNKRSGY